MMIVYPDSAPLSNSSFITLRRSILMFQSPIFIMKDLSPKKINIFYRTRTSVEVTQKVETLKRNLMKISQLIQTKPTIIWCLETTLTSASIPSKSGLGKNK